MTHVPLRSPSSGRSQTAALWRVARGLLLATAALSCSNDALDPDRASVASVVVVPSRLSVGVGASAPLNVEVRDAAGALLSGRKVAWATKDPTVATVSDGGVVTGVKAGPVQIAATAEGKSALVDVTVNPKSVATIRLTPGGDAQMLVGQTRQMTAETLDSEGAVLTGRAVTWTTNSATVASVSANGLITAVTPGGAVITVASEGKTAVVAVTVSSVPIASIAVTPAADEVVVSQTLQLTAVAKDAAGGTLSGRAVVWTTSDAAKATVSSTGLITGVAAGAVTITASAEGKSGTASITVKPKPVGAVILSPAQVSIEVAQTRQLSAQVTDDQGNVLSGRPIAYASENTSIATVSPSGVVTAVAIGATKINATSEGKTGSADVTVTAVPVATVEVSPPTTDLTIGQTANLAAVAKDSRGNVLLNRAPSWASGAPTVATVSTSGVVTAVGAGSAVIFATIEGRTGSAVVNVRQVPVTSVTVAPASSNIAVGAALQLVPTVRSGATVLTDRVVGWTSTNETIAVVSSTGRVTGLKAGVVTITATSEGVSGTAFVAVGISSVVVSPNPTSVVAGQTRQLTAVARDAANATVTGVPFVWSSANTTTATVDGNGLVTGRVAGVVSISAAVGTVSGSSSVTVTPAPVNTVEVTPAAPNVIGGQTVQLTATLKDAAGNVLTGRSTTWLSNNITFAPVNPTTGLVTTSSSVLAKGAKVTITATSEGKSGTSIVTIQ
jgi:trimeric autotransporter adhesin